ncbi:MAG TPA: TIM-barrel domain-containing protein, partial [Pseudonocardiaceae bacterium]
YGSLQAGGYSGPGALPTGPWADKRSTIHFTGDTSSTWGTLKAEVGYTPGEAAATGMSAISHDIGGHNDTTGLPGSETYVSGGQTHQTAKLPDDMYARWVQLGTFQPVDRLHSNHSDRLPWQYGAEAKASAEKFLTLREDLVPYTYTQAQQAATTGIPVVRPTYLQYPEEENAYATAGSEYLYGPDMLVAPVTTPGSTATTSVWFPPGQWTDYFTGRTYTGPSTQHVTTDWNSMPVFVKAGGIVPTRTDNVANDVQNPLTKVTLTVSGGADGSYSLYEDDGKSAAGGPSATTAVSYTENGHVLHIAPAQGTYSGQVTDREWTAVFTGATAPTTVRVDGEATKNWTFDPDRHTLTVTVPQRSVGTATTIMYS